MALSEVHGCDKIARAIEDSFEFQAFSSDYIRVFFCDFTREPLQYLIRSYF
jgi:hypothetical protein